MTGRIEALGTERAPGSIRAENGASVCFYVSEVLPRDTKSLVVGQLVSFEMERGTPPRAFNVSAEKQHYTSQGKERRQETVRYMGFEQAGNIRAYKFERLSLDGETQKAIVAADLALFLKHHVGIQEGPALCLRLVKAELDDYFNADEQTRLRSLTDQDMLAYLASQPVPEKRRYGSRMNAVNSRPASHSWRGSGPRTTS